MGGSAVPTVAVILIRENTVGTSDYRRRSYAKKGSTITLKVLGATANLPYGLQAYGPDCVGDKAKASKDGYFAYLAAPLKSKAIFVHEEKTKAHGVVFKMWESTKTKKGHSNDAPPGRSRLSKKRKSEPGVVERKIASMQKTIQSESKRNIEAQTILKGKWSGYIKCPSGEIILTRDIASFTTMALVSDPAKKRWSWAIHIKNLKDTHWFTKASKRVGSKGVKSISLTGSKATIASAFNDATRALFKTVAKAAQVQETVRRSAIDMKFRKQQKAGGPKRKGEAHSPMTKAEWARFQKLKEKGTRVGGIKAELKRQIKKAERAEAKAKRLAAKAKKAAKKDAPKKDAPKNGRRKEARAAKKAGKVRETASKAQKALKGKYITFNVDAGAQLKGKVGYVQNIGSNGRGNWDERSGGAKLYVLAVDAVGKVSNRLKTGTMEYKKGKRTFSTKGSGNFKKWMKVHADKRGDRSAYDLIREIRPGAESILGKRIVKAAKAAKPKPKNGRRKEARAAKTTTTRAAPKNGRRKEARAAKAAAAAKSPPKNGRRKEARAARAAERAKPTNGRRKEARAARAKELAKQAARDARKAAREAAAAAKTVPTNGRRTRHQKKEADKPKKYPTHGKALPKFFE